MAQQTTRPSAAAAPRLAASLLLLLTTVALHTAPVAAAPRPPIQLRSLRLPAAALPSALRQTKKAAPPACPAKCMAREFDSCPTGCVRRWCDPFSSKAAAAAAAEKPPRDLFRCEPPVCDMTTRLNGSEVVAECACQNAPAAPVELYKFGLFYSGRNDPNCIRNCAWSRLLGNCTASKNGRLGQGPVTKMFNQSLAECCKECGEFYYEDAGMCL